MEPILPSCRRSQSAKQPLSALAPCHGRRTHWLQGTPSAFPDREYICDTRVVRPVDSVAVRICETLCVPSIFMQTLSSSVRLFGMSLRLLPTEAICANETINSTCLRLRLATAFVSLVRHFASLWMSFPAETQCLQLSTVIYLNREKTLRKYMLTLRERCTLLGYSTSTPFTSCS